MTYFDRLETSPIFVRWLTLQGPIFRYAIIRKHHQAGYQWAIVDVDKGIVRQSGGCFYDDMGAKVPGPGVYHPNALVATAIAARAHARQVRQWVRLPRST